MTHLITITEQNGQRAVSARELYKFLEVTERFSNWFERQLQYGFTENIDYQGCKFFNTQANQELTDYVLSIDCAKENSMLQRTEKGKLARLYFIEMEKRAKEPQQKLLPTNKRNQQQIELIELIRANLLRGDVVAVAQENGFSRSTCENVMRHRCFHPKIVKALYDKALSNKKQLRSELQTMINELRKL